MSEHTLECKYVFVLSRRISWYRSGTTIWTNTTRVCVTMWLRYWSTSGFLAEEQCRWPRPAGPLARPRRRAPGRSRPTTTSTRTSPSCRPCARRTGTAPTKIDRYTRRWRTRSRTLQCSLRPFKVHRAPPNRSDSELNTTRQDFDRRSLYAEQTEMT